MNIWIRKVKNTKKKKYIRKYKIINVIKKKDWMKKKLRNKLKYKNINNKIIK